MRNSRKIGAEFGTLVRLGTHKYECELALLTLSPGSQGATYKYKVWIRHRNHSCCNRLEELLAHPTFQVKVSLEALSPAFPLISKVLHSTGVEAFDASISSFTCLRDFYLDIFIAVLFHCVL